MAIAVAFLAAFAVDQWGKLPDYHWRFRAGWVAPAVIATILFCVALAEAWRQIVLALGGRLDRRAAINVLTKSVLARHVPTGALMLVSLVVLAEREGVPRRTTLLSLHFQVWSANVAAVMVGGYSIVTTDLVSSNLVRILVIAIAPLGLVAMHPRIFRPFLNAVLRRLGQEPLDGTVPFRRILTFVGLQTAASLFLGAGLLAFTLALYPIPVSAFPHVLAALTLGFFVGKIALVVPSGVAIRDAAVAILLTATLPLGVAGTAVIGFRLLQIAVQVALVAATGVAARSVARAPRQAAL
jgi:hypothetical protein